MVTVIDADVAERELTKHGYSTRKHPSARHRALFRSVREDGALTVFRRLNLIWIWNSTPDPSAPGGRRPKNEAGRAAYADRNFVGGKFDVSDEPGFQLTRGGRQVHQ